VSTAYYALFHHLSYCLVVNLIPTGSEDDRLRLTRSIDHGSIKTVCEWIAGQHGAPLHSRPIVDRLANTELTDVALSFLDLYQARQSADYDHFASFTKPAALQYVNSARDAIRIVDGLPIVDRDAFLALVAVQIRKVQ
jgi:hypothetical protein